MAAKTAPTAKMDLSQIMLIVTLVTQFVSKAKAAVKGTTSQKIAALVDLVRDALPTIETFTGKDLVNDERFNAALDAIAAAFIKAPAKKAR